MVAFTVFGIWILAIPLVILYLPIVKLFNPNLSFRRIEQKEMVITEDSVTEEN